MTDRIESYVSGSFSVTSAPPKAGDRGEFHAQDRHHTPSHKRFRGKDDIANVCIRDVPGQGISLQLQEITTRKDGSRVAREISVYLDAPSREKLVAYLSAPVSQ